MMRLGTMMFPSAIAMMSQLGQLAVNAVDNVKGVKITYRGPSDIHRDEIANIIKGWTYWGSAGNASFLDFLADDACNLVLGKLKIKGVKPKHGYDSWCGKAKYKKLAHKWTKDSKKKGGKKVGDLVPPHVVVVGNMVTFEEAWEGGPDVNNGKPVKEDVVMTLNAAHKVTNVVYGLRGVKVKGSRAAEAAGVEHEAKGKKDFNIEFIGKRKLKKAELKNIIHGWTYWGSKNTKSFLDFVSDDMCNLVLGPLKVGGVDFHGDVTSWCGRTHYQKLAASWVAASRGSSVGDVSPPAVKVIGNMVVFAEDWKGGPLINYGKPVREDVVMIIEPTTHKVTDVIYGVDRSSLATK